MKSWLLSFLLIVSAASIVRSESVRIPNWLVDDYCFEVSGSSNEVMRAESVLAQTRSAIRPEIRHFLDQAGVEGSYFQWLVAASLPGIKNDDERFEYFRKALLERSPLSADCLNLVQLTNAAARVRYVPPAVRLELVFGGSAKNARTRAVPGVDYPGFETEDAESTPGRLRIKLCAPKQARHFVVRASSWPNVYKNLEYKWILPKDLYVPWGPRKGENGDEVFDLFLGMAAIDQRGPLAILVFAREKGRPWGAPSMITVNVDKLGKRKYSKGVLVSTDYGLFTDWYQLDENGDILGFERTPNGMVHGEEYSLEGELIVERYPGGAPKITRKVRYSECDGVISYSVEDGEISHKNKSITPRSYTW